MDEVDLVCAAFIKVERRNTMCHLDWLMPLFAVRKLRKIHFVTEKMLFLQCNMFLYYSYRCI